ncbi:MAG: tetratricopeptide repeat protein [Acidobacteriota bacterium]
MSWAVRGSTRWTSVFIRLSGLLASAAAMGTALSPPAGASGSLVAATGVHGWLAQKRQSPQREIDAYARHMSAGVLHMNEEQYAAAISEFTAALELRPGDIEAAFMLAGAQIAAGDLRQAGKIYERLDSSHPESPVGPFGLGQLHFLVGRMDAAETSLREALSRNSGYLRAWYYLGQVLEAGGRRAEAKQAYQEMLDRFPQARLAALALAKLQLEDNQAAAAAEALEPLESLRPPDPEVLTLLGVAQARSGRQEEASRTLQRVVEVDSGRVEAFYNLGL